MVIREPFIAVRNDQRVTTSVNPYPCNRMFGSNVIRYRRTGRFNLMNRSVKIES